MSKLKYKRVLLKLSGEALAGSDGKGIDPHEADAIAQRVVEEIAAMSVAEFDKFEKEISDAMQEGRIVK